MDEYIEREAVTCADCIHYDICIFHHKGNENEKCMHFKNKADVVEVRHGEWEKAKQRGVVIYADVYAECSVCHGEPTFSGWKMNYCPNCGAKMRGGER